MNQALTVSQFVEVINTLLEGLASVVVEGEIASYKVIQNKWVVFDLKDQDSKVGCFMPVWNLRTQIEDGMLVRAIGTPKLRDQGFFSFVIESLQPAGEGALKRAFELLQAKLASEGLFSNERKRPLPRFPEHIALITSRDAAAYNDFLKVLTARLGGLNISFIHTQVQGVEAPSQIISAINQANIDLQQLDAIVLVRGGGSLEDLHAFNDEQVVRAVAASRVPTIVGIGHERDITLAELAADVRASTPSNAAELLVPSRGEILIGLENMVGKITGTLTSQIDTRRYAITQSLNILSTRFTASTVAVSTTIDSLRKISTRLRHDLAAFEQTLPLRRAQLSNRWRLSAESKNANLTQLIRILESLSPERVLSRGFSITTDNAGKIITSVKKLSPGSVINTKFRDGQATSKVITND